MLFVGRVGVEHTRLQRLNRVTIEEGRFALKNQTRIQRKSWQPAGRCGHAGSLLVEIVDGAVQGQAGADEIARSLPEVVGHAGVEHQTITLHLCRGGGRNESGVFRIHCQIQTAVAVMEVVHINLRQSCVGRSDRCPWILKHLIIDQPNGAVPVSRAIAQRRNAREQSAIDAGACPDMAEREIARIVIIGRAIDIGGQRQSRREHMIVAR